MTIDGGYTRRFATRGGRGVRPYTKLDDLLAYRLRLREQVQIIRAAGFRIGA